MMGAKPPMQGGVQEGGHKFKHACVVRHEVSINCSKLLTLLALSRCMVQLPV